MDSPLKKKAASRWKKVSSFGMAGLVKKGKSIPWIQEKIKISKLVYKLIQSICKDNQENE